MVELISNTPQAYFMKPEYLFVMWCGQRATAWKPADVEHFTNQLISENAFAGKRCKIVSTFVLESVGFDENGSRKYAIYDGQQRATTLQLIALALICLVDEHQNNEITSLARDYLAMLHPAKFVQTANESNDEGSYSLTADDGSFQCRLSLKRTDNDTEIDGHMNRLAFMSDDELRALSKGEGQVACITRNFMAIKRVLKNRITTNEELYQLVNVLHEGIDCFYEVAESSEEAGSKFTVLNRSVSLLPNETKRALCCTHYNNNMDMISTMQILDSHEFKTWRIKLFLDRNIDTNGSDSFFNQFLDSLCFKRGDDLYDVQMLKKIFVNPDDLTHEFKVARDIWIPLNSISSLEEYNRLTLRNKISLSFIYRVGINGNDSSSLQLALHIERLMRNESDHKLAEVYDVLIRYFYANTLGQNFNKTISLGEKLIGKDKVFYYDKAPNTETLAEDLEKFLKSLKGSSAWPTGRELIKIYSKAYEVKAKTAYAQIMQDIISYCDVDLTSSTKNYGLTRNYNNEANSSGVSSFSTEYKDGLVQFNIIKGQLELRQPNDNDRGELGTFVPTSYRVQRDDDNSAKRVKWFLQKARASNSRSYDRTGESVIYKSLATVMKNYVKRNSISSTVQNKSLVKDLKKIMLRAIVGTYGKRAGATYTEPSIARITKIYSAKGLNGNAVVTYNNNHYLLNNSGLTTLSGYPINTFDDFTTSSDNLKIVITNDQFLDGAIINDGDSDTGLVSLREYAERS